MRRSEEIWEGCVLAAHHRPLDAVELERKHEDGLAVL